MHCIIVYVLSTLLTTYFLSYLFVATETIHRKEQKKVTKLQAQIPYHEGRGNKEEVTKIKEQIDAIWEKAREASWA